MRELFEAFVENRCPTFWERVKEKRYMDKEEFFWHARNDTPRNLVMAICWWSGTTEGHDYWREVSNDWKYIVEQEEKK